jgi:hypothetical protein
MTKENAPKLALSEVAAILNEAQYSGAGCTEEGREVLRKLALKLAICAFPQASTLTSEVEETDLRRARFIRVAGFRLPDTLKHLESKTTPPNWLASLAVKARFIMQGARK